MKLRLETALTQIYNCYVRADNTNGISKLMMLKFIGRCRPRLSEDSANQIVTNILEKHGDGRHLPLQGFLSFYRSVYKLSKKAVLRDLRKHEIDTDGLVIGDFPRSGGTPRTSLNLKASMGKSQTVKPEPVAPRTPGGALPVDEKLRAIMMRDDYKSRAVQKGVIDRVRIYAKRHLAGHMPTYVELEQMAGLAGTRMRTRISILVRDMGGVTYVARKTGLHATRRKNLILAPRGLCKQALSSVPWSNREIRADQVIVPLDHDNAREVKRWTVQRVLAEVKELGRVLGRMPSDRDLRRINRRALARRIYKLGGFTQVGKMCRLEVRGKAPPIYIPGTSTQVNINKQEHIFEVLRRVAKLVGHFPTQKDLKCRGMYAVHKRVRAMGGRHKVNRRLKLPFTENQRRRHGVQIMYKWTRPAAREAVLQICKDLRLTRMPTSNEIVYYKNKRFSAMHAIICGRFGGMEAFSQYCGLPYVGPRHRKGGRGRARRTHWGPQKQTRKRKFEDIFELPEAKLPDFNFPPLPEPVFKKRKLGKGKGKAKGKKKGKKLL